MKKVFQHLHGHMGIAERCALALLAYAVAAHARAAAAIDLYNVHTTGYYYDVATESLVAQGLSVSPEWAMLTRPGYEGSASSETFTLAKPEGYYMSGWRVWKYSNGDVSSPYDKPAYGASKEVTVSFTDLEDAAIANSELCIVPDMGIITYELAYDANGGAWVDTPTGGEYEYFDTVMAASATSAKKDGNTPICWNTKKSGTGLDIAFGEAFDGSKLQLTTTGGSVTLYAKWKANDYNLALTVGTGIAAIYYKTNAASAYVSTTQDKVVPVAFGETWSAYAVAKPGYTYTLYSSEDHPLTGIMGLEGGKFEPKGNANMIYVRYERNGATDGTMSDDGFTYDDPTSLKLNSYAKRYTIQYRNVAESIGDSVVSAVFNGWNNRADGKGAYQYANGETVTNPCGSTGTDAAHPVQLFAQWGAGTVELPTPKKAGYYFVGWYTANVGGTRAGGGGDSYSPAGDKTEIELHAHWRPNSCTVTFDVNGEGTLPSAQATGTYVYGDTYEAYGELPEPASTSISRAFAGWYTKETGGTLVQGGSTVALESETATLYAHWTDVRYAISYELNGGAFTGTPPKSYVPGIGVSLPSAKNVTKAHAQFGGWYDNSRFDGSPVTQVGKTEIGNKKFYAKWLDNTVTVTYEYGATDYTRTYAYGANVQLESALFSAEGSVQTGWQQMAKTNIFNFGASIINVTNDWTFLPTWTPKTYTIEFIPNGEDSETSLPDDITATNGIPVQLPVCTCTKGGKLSAGWTLRKDGVPVYDSGATVLNLTSQAGAKVTLYNAWKSDPSPVGGTYTIRFSPGADVVNPDAIPDMTNCVSRVATSLPACVYTNLAPVQFVGWYGDGTIWSNAVSFTHSVKYDGEVITLQGVWEENTDTLSSRVGLTNAVLRDCDAQGWAKDEYEDDAVSVQLSANESSQLSMRVRGPGKAVFQMKCNTTECAEISYPGEEGQFLPTMYQVYTNEVSGSATELHDVTWTVAANKKCTCHLKDVRWIPDAVPEYTVTGEAKPSAGGSVSGGGAAVPVGTPVRFEAVANAGYYFTHWSDGSSNAVLEVRAFRNMAYEAYFAQGEGAGHYYVVFNGDGATGTMADQVCECGIPTSLTPNGFSRTGYTFDHWEDAFGLEYKDGATVTDLAATNKAVALKAAWTANAYTIVFDGSGATSGTNLPLSCRYDTPVQLPANAFKKPGYEFLGWKNAGQSYVANSFVYENLTAQSGGVVTMTAIWQEVKIDREYVEVSIRGNTATKHHTGYPLSVEGYVVASRSKAEYPEEDIRYVGTAVASGTAVGTYAMRLDANAFTNLNEYFNVTFVIESDGELEIITSKIGGEPGAGTGSGVSKFDTTGAYGGTFDGAALSNAFVSAGYAVTGVEYAPLPDAAWSTEAPTYVTIGATSFWYRVSAENYEPFEHEVLVKVEKGTMADPQIPAQSVAYDGQPHAFDTAKVAAAFAGYGVVEITYSPSESGPWDAAAPVVLTDAATTSFWYRVTSDNYKTLIRPVTFAVAPRDMANVTIADIPDQPWTGSAVQPPVTVTDAGAPITADDYDVAYADNVDIGRATVTLTGKRNYGGTKTAAFNVLRAAIVVKIVGHTATNPYNGFVQSVEGYDVVIPEASRGVYGEGDIAFTGTAAASGTDVGTYAMGLKADQFANTKTSVDVVFEVTDGALVITPLPGQYVSTYGVAESVDLLADYPGIKSVSGLPSGLKYNKTTGYVTGTPKKVVYDKAVTVKLTDGTKETLSWTVKPGANSGAKIDFGAAAYGGGARIDIGTAVSWAVTADAGAKVKVSQLPSGLKYKNGVITGTAKKAGEKTVTVKVTAGGTTVTQTFDVTVVGLPEYMVGTYYGMAAVADGSCGQFTLKVTAAGKVTGSFYAAGKKVTVKSSALYRSGEGYVTTVTYKYNRASYADEIVLAATNAVGGVDLWCAALGGESDVLRVVDARRDAVKDVYGKVASGKYAVEDAGFAEGEFLSAKVSSGGTVKVSGKLYNANGALVSVTCSTKLAVLADGRLGCWITIYKKSAGQPIQYVRFWEP